MTEISSVKNLDIISAAVLFALSFVFVLFCFSSNPLLDSMNSDGAAFLYVGECINRGLVLYRDISDNKGPLLYFINAFALLISGNRIFGVWIVECFFAVVSIWVCFRFLMKFCPYEKCVWIVVVVLSLWAVCGSPGNFCETYAYPFILYAWLLVARSILCNRFFSVKECLFIGFSTGAVFLLRPNMVTFSFVVAIYFIDELVRRRDFRQFAESVLWCAVGAILVCVPFVCYFWWHNAFYDLWENYWLFNISQAGRFESCLYVCLVPMCLICSVWSLLIVKESHWKRCLVYNLCFSVLSSAVICIKPAFAHYFVPLVPCFIVPFVVLANRFNRMAFCGSVMGLVVLAAVAFKANFEARGLIDYIGKNHSLPNLEEFKDENEINEAMSLRSSIQDSESVCCVGLYCLLYRKLGVHCKGRFAFFYPPANVLKSFDEEIRGNISMELNRYLILKDGWGGEVKPLIDEHYRMIAKAGRYQLYERKKVD